MRAHRLVECKTFTTQTDDCVLLRIRTANQPEAWYGMLRKDFFELADYLAADAEQMRRLQ